MAQVNVTINGREFRMACEDGQEDHLRALVRDIDERVARLRKQFGEIGDSRLTVMAAITAVDDLSEANKTIQRLQGEVDALRQTGTAAAGRAQETESQVSSALHSAAERIEAIARSLHQSANGAGGTPPG